MKLKILILSFCFSSALAAPAIQVDSKDLKDIPAPHQIPADPRAEILQSTSQESDEPQNIGLVLDSSGSMGQILEKNKTKMFFLKKLMKDFIKQQWKMKNKIDVRVYGSRAKSKCDDIINPIPYSDHSLPRLENSLEKMEPLGMTPLHKSILQTVEGIKNRPGPKKVLIVTDGEDTCGGDPCKTAESLKKDKLDIRFFVIALGGKDESESLKKLTCLGDVHSANDSQSFSDAVSQISAKISGRENLKVISPNPDAAVYLYRQEAGKQILDRVFYASSEQSVAPGQYEAIVGLNPAYKFQNVVIVPHKKTILKVQGEGQVLINYFGSYLKAQLLDNNNKVVAKFKSDVPLQAPTGKWKLRIYREPFYENIISNFFVYPNGHHVVDVNGVGVLRVDAKEVEGVYVYDQDNVLIDHTLTQFPFILKTGVYSVHVNESCSFQKVEVRDKKEVIVLPCN